MRRSAERGTDGCEQPAAEDGGVAWQQSAAPLPGLGLASDNPFSWGAPGNGRERKVDTGPRRVGDEGLFLAADLASGPHGGGSSGGRAVAVSLSTGEQWLGSSAG